MPMFYMPPGPLLMTGTTCCYNRRPLTHALTSSTVSATERTRKVATERSPVVGFERPQPLAHPAATFPDSLAEWVHTSNLRQTKREGGDLLAISKYTCAGSVASRQHLNDRSALTPTKRELCCAVKSNSPRTCRVQSKFRAADVRCVCAQTVARLISRCGLSSA